MPARLSCSKRSAACSIKLVFCFDLLVGYDRIGRLAIDEVADQASARKPEANAIHLFALSFAIAQHQRNDPEQWELHLAAQLARSVEHGTQLGRGVRSDQACSDGKQQDKRQEHQAIRPHRLRRNARRVDETEIHHRGSHLEIA